MSIITGEWQCSVDSDSAESESLALCWNGTQTSLHSITKNLMNQLTSARNTFSISWVVFCRPKKKPKLKRQNGYCSKTSNKKMKLAQPMQVSTWVLDIAFICDSSGCKLWFLSEIFYILLRLCTDIECGCAIHLESQLNRFPKPRACTWQSVKVLEWSEPAAKIASPIVKFEFLQHTVHTSFPLFVSQSLNNYRIQILFCIKNILSSFCSSDHESDVSLLLKLVWFQETYYPVTALPGPVLADSS